MSNDSRTAQRAIEAQAHMTYMQFSKKVAVASIVSWIITFLCAMAYVVLLPINSLTADLVKTITGYSATLTGTVIVAYMGNSGLEKYARYKYDFESAGRDMGSPPPTTITYTRPPNSPGLG